jgi:hypothetical protein
MESKTLTEAAVLLRSNETELLRTVVRMAGRSQLSEERLIEILLEAVCCLDARSNHRCFQGYVRIDILYVYENPLHGRHQFCWARVFPAIGGEWPRCHGRLEKGPPKSHESGPVRSGGPAQSA